MAKKIAKKKISSKAKVKKAAKKKPAKKVAKKTSKKKSSLLEKIAAHRREIERIKSKSEKSGAKLFKMGVKQIFSEFPEVQSFSWRQYTPNWNDGDTCVFGCHFESMTLKFSSGKEDSEDLWTLEHLSDLFSGDVEKKRKEIEKKISEVKQPWEKNSLESNLKDLNSTTREEMDRINEIYFIKKTIVELLQGIDESVLQSMFGEGEVSISRDGATTEDCDHD